MVIHSSALRIYPADDILNGRFSRPLRLEQSLLCRLGRVKNLVLTGSLELRIVLWLVFLGTEIKTPETPPTQHPYYIKCYFLQFHFNGIFK